MPLYDIWMTEAASPPAVATKRWWQRQHGWGLNSAFHAFVATVSGGFIILLSFFFFNGLFTFKRERDSVQVGERQRGKNRI